MPTIDALLASRAATRPDAVFLRFGARTSTFRETADEVEQRAAGLAGLGVTAGALVPVVMENRWEFVVTWLALARLGAVATLVNDALRGPALVHAVEVTGAPLVVTSDAGAAALGTVGDELRSLTTVVTCDDPGVAARHLPGRRVRHLGALEPVALAPAGHGVADPAMVLFTSGTTGASKGCVLSHRYAVRQAQLMVEHLALRADDVLYCPFPLFHLDASVLTVLPALVLGTTAVIAERFSVSRFWDDVRASGATVFDFMGATLTMLHKVPPAPDDADNPVRLAWGVPVPEFAEAFEARFGLRLVELYGSTDAGLPIYQPLHEPRVPGSCGRPIASYDIEVVDPDDQPVGPGAVGELLVRPREPSLMSDRYHGMPEASAAARRNLWFHTGDLVRRDAAGNVFFVGRMTDSIRRRGENISAFEVEEVVKLHPDVLDAAAFGVPSELTEDDVMVAVVARPGHRIEPAGLLAFCAGRMARHMLPRYVEVLAELPRTPTEKVEKPALRARGVTPATWDRERDASPAGA